MISDELWAVLEPVLPPRRSGKRGRPAADHRACLEAIAWRYRTGAPWRDLPVDLGKWQTAWKRHRRWSGDGTYAELFAEVQRHYGVAGDPDGLVEQLLSIDSTSVRAHRHAAGCPLPYLARIAGPDPAPGRRSKKGHHRITGICRRSSRMIMG